MATFKEQMREDISLLLNLSAAYPARIAPSAAFVAVSRLFSVSHQSVCPIWNAVPVSAGISLEQIEPKQAPEQKPGEEAEPEKAPDQLSGVQELPVGRKGRK